MTLQVMVDYFLTVVFPWLPVSNTISTTSTSNNSNIYTSNIIARMWYGYAVNRNIQTALVKLIGVGCFNHIQNTCRCTGIKTCRVLWWHVINTVHSWRSLFEGTFWGVDLLFGRCEGIMSRYRLMEKHKYASQYWCNNTSFWLLISNPKKMHNYRWMKRKKKKR